MKNREEREEKEMKKERKKGEDWERVARRHKTEEGRRGHFLKKEHEDVIEHM